MILPKNPTAFDVARKVLCDAWDLKVSGDLHTLDMLLEAADHVVGCGYSPDAPEEWKNPPPQRKVQLAEFSSAVFGMDTKCREWWLRYIAARDVRDCLLDLDKE